MITLTITLASITAYMAAGYYAALRNLPRAWGKARDSWYGIDDTVRTSVKGQTIAMFTLWPAYLTLIFASDRLSRFVEAADPEVAAEKIRQQERRIAQLERDLGIR